MTEPPPPTLRELKVLLPRRLAVGLHSEKILTGRTIASLVEEALRDYFDAHAGEIDLGEEWTRLIDAATAS